jgi:glucan phosphorylase
MTDEQWLEVLGMIAYRSHTPLPEVMRWPLPAIREYSDRVMPLFEKVD